MWAKTLCAGSIGHGTRAGVTSSACTGCALPISLLCVDFPPCALQRCSPTPGRCVQYRCFFSMKNPQRPGAPPATLQARSRACAASLRCWPLRSLGRAAAPSDPAHCLAGVGRMPQLPGYKRCDELEAGLKHGRSCRLQGVYPLVAHYTRATSMSYSTESTHTRSVGARRCTGAGRCSTDVDDGAVRIDTRGGMTFESLLSRSRARFLVSELSQ